MDYFGTFRAEEAENMGMLPHASSRGEGDSSDGEREVKGADVEVSRFV